MLSQYEQNLFSQLVYAHQDNTKALNRIADALESLRPQSAVTGSVASNIPEHLIRRAEEARRKAAENAGQ